MAAKTKKATKAAKAPKSIQVDRAEAEALLEQLNYKKTSKWTEARMLGTLKSLHEKVDDDTDAGDFETLLDSIVKAGRKGAPIEIIDNEDDEEEDLVDEEEDEEEGIIDDEEDEEEEDEEDEEDNSKSKSKKGAKGKAAKGKAAKGKAAKGKAAKSKDSGSGVGRPRVTVFSYSASAIAKWMGKKGWTIEEAEKAISKLGKGGEVKRSTIIAGLSDGRSEKYQKGAASPTKEEAAKLSKAAGRK